MTRSARIRALAALLAVAKVGLAGPAGAQTPVFEVEDAQATKLAQVNDDGGFVARGKLGAGIVPVSGAGVRLMWHPAKAALRAGLVDGGEWDDAKIGEGSVAFGKNTTARGPNSTAMGVNNQANGVTATAMGQGTRADGKYSTAMGLATTAIGDQSVALGTGVTAQGGGSFAFGDLSTGFPVNAGPNEFLVRAFGGIGLNSGANIGCDLPAGTGAWSCTSSRLAKEAFEDVDGEAALKQLAQIPIQRWRYTGTEAAHLGPTAEDFHAAFGLGESKTKIATVDANGVSLLGVQALERRTASLREETAALREENLTLRADNAELRRRIEALEAAGGRP